MDGRDEPKKDRPEDRIARLMKESSPAPARDRRPAKPKSPAAAGITVSGTGNFVAGGDINMNLGPAPRPKVTVKTGDGVIDARQKAELQRLMKLWLTARNVVRKTPMTPAAGWSALNAAMGVNSYSELTPEQFPAAKKWLSKQKGILHSMKSAPLKIDGYRNEAIKAIKARSKQLGDLHFYVPHIVKTYGAESLTHLSDQQLQELRAWIMRQKRAER